jgi:competence protein ComEC
MQFRADMPAAILPGMNWRKVKQKLHVSWFIASVSVGIIGGVAMVAVVDVRLFSHPLWLFGGLLVIGVVLYKRFIWLVSCMILAGTMVGLWRGSVERVSLLPYDSFYGKTAIIKGELMEDSEKGKASELVIKLSVSSISGENVGGKVWASAASSEVLKKGDSVVVRGMLNSGFGSFSGVLYRAYVAKTEESSNEDLAGQVSDWFASRIKQVISEPEASLGVGYLVGQRSALPVDLDAALVTAGLTHIVVASGYNLTILVRLTRRLFARISKYFSTFVAFVMIASFIAVTGVSPSMSRAGLVTGLSLLAWYYGRKFHPLVLLPFSAAITVVIVPSYAWGDVGWLLSFTAFGGVMVLAPLMQEYFFGKKKANAIRQIGGETIAAHIATLPVLLCIFGQLSNIAVPANLLILPFVPLAMFLVFVAGVGAGFGSWIGMPAEWLLHYMTTTARYLAALPGSQSQIHISVLGCVGMYVVIVIFCVYAWRKTGLNLRNASIVE